MKLLANTFDCKVAKIAVVIPVAALSFVIACSSSKPSSRPTSESASNPSTPAPRHLQVSPTDKVLGYVEWLTATPTGQDGGEQLWAQGWAVSCVAGVPLKDVTLLIDGKFVGNTTNFTGRPDVASAYDKPDFGQSGWKIEVPIKKVGPGEHVLTVRATNANGDSADLPGKTLTIK